MVLALDTAGFSELCSLISDRRLNPDFDLPAALKKTSCHVAMLTDNLVLAKAVSAAKSGKEVYFELVDHSPRGEPGRMFQACWSASLAGGSGKLHTVAARDLPQHTGRQVWAYGWLVTWRRTRVQRTGKIMKFVTLEDLTATFEVTLFPDAYSREWHKFHGPGPYLVRGRVENDHGAITLTAERMENLGAGRNAGIGIPARPFSPDSRGLGADLKA